MVSGSAANEPLPSPLGLFDPSSSAQKASPVSAWALESLASALLVLVPEPDHPADVSRSVERRDGLCGHYVPRRMDSSIGGERITCRLLNAAPEGGPRPRDAGRHRADFHLPHATRHEWACVPGGIRRASSGCLPRRSLPSRSRGIGQGFGRPRAAARVHRARSSRPLVLQGKGTSASRSRRPCGVRQDRLSWLVNLHGFPKQPVYRVLPRPAAGSRRVSVDAVNTYTPRRRPTRMGPARPDPLEPSSPCSWRPENACRRVGPVWQCWVEGSGHVVGGKGQGWVRVADVRAVRPSWRQQGGRAARPRRHAPGPDRR